ncbi:MAG: hypothetical protein NT031_06890 [Planctomycetota bacterium]|nr:hypothetical protein [Planctomycetota bacterium]
MILGGLWHGASWTFVAWGFYHGLLLCLFRPFERRRNAPARAWPIVWLQRVLMFHLVCLGSLLFRADTFTQAAQMGVKIFTDLHATRVSTFGLGMIAFFALPLLALEALQERRGDIHWLPRTNWLLRAGAYAYAVYMMILFLPTTTNEFIYFQF